MVVILSRYLMDRDKKYYTLFIYNMKGSYSVFKKNIFIVDLFRANDNI